jgi:hypothetical protein
MHPNRETLYLLGDHWWEQQGCISRDFLEKIALFQRIQFAEVSRLLRDWRQPTIYAVARAHLTRASSLHLLLLESTSDSFSYLAK